MIAEVEAAAHKYLGAHNSRLKAKEAEDFHNEALVKVMRANELTEYRTEGHLFRVKQSAAKATAKRIDRKPDENGDGEQEDEGDE